MKHVLAVMQFTVAGKLSCDALSCEGTSLGYNELESRIFLYMPPLRETDFFI